MQANIKNMEDAQRIAELESEVSEYKLKVTLGITINTHPDKTYRNKLAYSYPKFCSTERSECDGKRASSVPRRRV